MANTTFEERRLLRVDLAKRATLIAQGHRATAALQERKGNVEKAAEATEAAVKQETLAARHAAEAGRLEKRAQANAYRLQDGEKAKAALEARAAVQKIERTPVDPLQAFIEAAQHAQRHEAQVEDLTAKREGFLRVGKDEKAAHLTRLIEQRTEWAKQWREEALALIASSGRDLTAEWAAQTAKQQASDTLEGDARRARKELSLPIDMRTAGAQREFVAGSARDAKIASLAEYENLIPRPHARSNRRIDAMAKFDKLCSWAEEGLYPTVDLLKGGGGGSGGDSYHTNYAQGLMDLDALGRAIGGQNVEMLRRRIYQRQTLTQLAREGFGSEKTVGILILAAIDAMAVHFAGKPDGNAIVAGRASVEASARLAP